MFESIKQTSWAFFYLESKLSKTLSNEDYFKASQELNCEPEALMACADNESSGAGFDNGGDIVIRFEGHVFRKYTQGKFDKSHPEVSYSYANRHGKTHSHSAFNIAFGLDPVAALMATSWGKFQPMGFTFDECGFADVNSYVDFLKESEDNELICFVRLIKHRHLADELQRHDWLGFAKVYNGADQASNGYDVKMGAAYKRHKAQKIDWSQFGKVSAVPAAIQPVNSDSSPLPLDSATQPPEVSNAGENEAQGDSEQNNDITPKTPDPPNTDKIAIVKQPNFFKNLWAKLSGMVTGNFGLDALSEKWGQIQAFGLPMEFWKKLVYFTLAGCLIYLIIQGYRHYQGKRITAHLIAANTTPTNEVVLVDPEKVDDFKAQGYKIVSS